MVVVFRDGQHTLPGDVASAQNVFQKGNHVLARFRATEGNNQDGVIIFWFRGHSSPVLPWLLFGPLAHGTRGPQPKCSETLCCRTDTCHIGGILVRPERFELPTCCSGGNRSIQLSYGRRPSFTDLLNDTRLS